MSVSGVYPTETGATQLTADEHAYVLVEQARLRCEHFRDTTSTVGERVALDPIHRELGMAGLLACSDIAPARRLVVLAAAHQYAMTPMVHPRHAHALAAAAIEGEDAVAAAEARDIDCEHMHAARLHLLCAMELLAALV